MTEDLLGRSPSTRRPFAPRLTEQDVELLDRLCEALGITRSEALRTVIRGFVPIFHRATGMKPPGATRQRT